MLLQVLVALFALSNASPVAQPVVTPAPDAALVKRATSCTFSGASGAASASKSQKSCSTIVLSSVAVPSGVTLDLSDLPDDTSVSRMGKGEKSRLLISIGHLRRPNNVGLRRMGWSAPSDRRHRYEFPVTTSTHLSHAEKNV